MTRRQHVLLALLGVGALCTVVLVGSCSKDKRAQEEQAQRHANLQAAYDAVAAVQRATKAGVAYDDYAKLVPTASAALLAYEAPDEKARDVIEHLSAAVYAYQTATRAWATQYDECQDCAWRKFVNAHPQFALEDADPEYAVVTLWNQALADMNAAAEGLAAYPSGRK